MKNFLFILICIALLISCKNLGKLVDEKKSDSYFITSEGQIVFCQSGNWFELGIDSMQADVKSFRVLSNYIAKDKNVVYYRSIPQKQVDQHSFYIENNIPKDRFHAYYIDESLGFQPIEEADPKTFQYLDSNNIWARDKDHYFLNYKKLSVDRKSFSRINQTFSQDKDSIYINTESGDFKSILRNNGNYKAINDNYLRIGNVIYYTMYHPNPKLLTNSFDSISKIRIIDNDIICVNNILISYGKKFPYSHADVNSFQLYPPDQLQIKDDLFAKDKNNVYYDGQLIEGADVKTFTPLSFKFGKDAKNAFYKTKLLKGVDSKSFGPSDNFDSKGHFGFKDNLGNKFDYSSGNKIQ